MFNSTVFNGIGGIFNGAQGSVTAAPAPAPAPTG